MIKTFPKLISAKYQFYYSISPLVVRLCKEAENKTTQANVGIKSIQDFCFPLPPLNTQVRIADKVDALMLLCDQLEQQSYQSIDAHNQLVDTLLQTLVDSTNADELASNWQRLSEHFDTLFTTEYSIDALKQTILQLAVMGKLVKQDPTDEPASELLKRIAKEKEALVKAGKIKKQKPLPSIIDDEKPFELLCGWEWCRLGTIGLTFTGKTPSTSKHEFFNGDIPFIGPGQINQLGQVLTSDKSLTECGIIESTEGLPGDILTVCIGGSIGKSAIVHHRISYNQQINAIRPILVNTEYTYFAMATNKFKNSIIEASSGSATPIINRSKWESLNIPLPPIKEQLRIVKAITELFGMCDSLSNRIESLKETQLLLSESLLYEVVA